MTVLSYSKTSSYEIVREALGRLVENMKLMPGDRLPSEITLSKQFGVSRPILREAYRLLERDGVIFVRCGAGTFLGNPSPIIKNPLNDLCSTGMIIHQAGFDASVGVQELVHCEPESEWSEKLHLDKGENVVVSKRLRRANDTNIALSWDIMPEHLVNDKFDNGITKPIFWHLEKECQVVIVSAHTGISALNLSLPYDVEAKNTLGDMTILMKRQHFDAKGLPILFSLHYMRTDLVELTVQQERKKFYV